ncbi:unnamed protein product [Prunus armeniaca]|uniref:Uncharacterized protein n=1 Tax=Prunus armeniaca TaxID=36596 RepID=A0A6J5WK77_PRUAR|nr:unnamed protein product [Prunus armeniaca]
MLLEREKSLAQAPGFRLQASGFRLQAPGSSHVKESIKIRFVIVARGEASSLPLNLNSGPQI